MSDIISFDRYQLMRRKEDMVWRNLNRAFEDCEMAAADDAENPAAESAVRMMSAMGEMACAMADTPFGQYVAETEKKMETDFRKRYNEVFDRQCSHCMPLRVRNAQIVPNWAAPARS